MGSIIGMLVGKTLFGRTITEPIARAIAYAGLALLLLALFAVGKCSYDRSVIAHHEAKQDAANAKADRKADSHAAEQRRVDDARLTQERQQLERSDDNAKTDLDRRLAFQRCLRLQQAARRERKQPPTCG